jgi:hypothetical protein
MRALPRIVARPNNDMPGCPKCGLPACGGDGSPTMEERRQEERDAQQTADEQGGGNT